MAKTKRTKPTLAEVKRAKRIKDDDIKAKLELFKRSRKEKDPKKKKALFDKVLKLNRVETSMPKENINKTSRSNRLKNKTLVPFSRTPGNILKKSKPKKKK